MTTTISAVIFSRNRAMQLNATLESFEHCCYAKGDVNFRKSVLYRADTEQHARQYDELRNEFKSWNFIKESNFKKDLLAVVTKSDMTIYVVDDCVFVRQFDLGPAVQQLLTNDELLGVSLRLGRNVDYCYPTDSPQKVPEFTRQVIGGYWSFFWPNGQGDWGYPAEVSSSLYRTHDIPLEKINFTNPNTLEAALQGVTWTSPELLCFDTSVATCIPTNVVQSVYKNRSIKGGKTADELANEFDEGYRIDLASFAGKVPNACHMDWPLTLRKSP